MSISFFNNLIVKLIAVGVIGIILLALQKVSFEVFLLDASV